MRLTSVCAAAVLTASAGSVSAKGFDDLAKGAVELRGPAEVAAIFWSQQARCSSDNDFERRQCEAIRAARQEQVSGATYLIAAPGALGVGDFDGTKKSLELTVDGCISCDTGIELGGARRFVTGKGKPVRAGEGVRGGAAHTGAMVFKNAAEAEEWKKEVLPRLRTEILFRLPRTLDSWKLGGAEGFRVDILGVRVYDPCDGSIAAATPPADALGANSAACSEPEPKPEVAKTEPKKPAAPPEPALPERLSTGQINNALRPARKEAQACFDTYGVEGKAMFHISISGEGKVVALDQDGDFVGTPTGECLAKAIKATVFPKSAKKRTTVAYPVMLR